MKCERCHQDVDTVTFVDRLRRENVFGKDYSDAKKYAYMCSRCRRVYFAKKALLAGLWAVFILYNARNEEWFYLILIGVFLGCIFILKLDKIMAWFHGKPYIKKDPESGDD